MILLNKIWLLAQESLRENQTRLWHYFVDNICQPHSYWLASFVCVQWAQLCIEPSHPHQSLGTIFLVPSQLSRIALSQITTQQLVLWDQYWLGKEQNINRKGDAQKWHNSVQFKDKYTTWGPLVALVPVAVPNVIHPRLKPSTPLTRPLPPWRLLLTKLRQRGRCPWECVNLSRKSKLVGRWESRRQDPSAVESTVDKGRCQQDSRPRGRPDQDDADKYKALGDATVNNHADKHFKSTYVVREAATQEAVVKNTVWPWGTIG